MVEPFQGVSGRRAQQPSRSLRQSPSECPSSQGNCRLIPLLNRTPVRLEWTHDQHDDPRPRHRSSGPRARSGPPPGRGPRGGRAAAGRGHLGRPAPGRVDPRRGAAQSLWRAAARGRRPRRTPGRGVRGRRVRGRGRDADRDRQGLPRRGTGAAAPAARRPGPGSRPGTWRRGGPGGSPAPRSACRSRRRGSWTPRSRGSRTGSGPAVWTGWSRRRSSGSCPPRPVAAGRPPPTVGTRTCTPTRCPSRAPCGSRPRSTSPTPSTSTPPSRPVPRGSPTSAPPRRWTSAAPKPSARWRAPSWRSTSRPGETTSPRGRPARAPLRPTRSPARDEKLHLARVANTRSFVDADQVRAWCGHPGATVTVKPVVDLTDHIHVDAVRGPRPARRPDRAPRPDLRVPLVHPPGRGLRQGPRHPLRRGRADGQRQPRHRCAGVTTGSRPTTPAGATRSSNPAPTCGPHPTATSSSATTRGTTDVTHDRLAPARPVATPPHTPRRHIAARGHRHVPGQTSRPATTSPYPACEQRVSMWAGRCGRGAAGRERKRRRGGAGVRNPGSRRRRHGNSSDCR